MYSPEKNQVAICLLKSNLEDIENQMVCQRSTCPDLDAENEQKMRETMDLLSTARYLVAEVEKLRQDNVRLSAKRMQLKYQSEEIGKALNTARDYRDEMEIALQHQDKDIEQLTRNYEDCLCAKANRFRSSRAYYNEEQMLEETQRVTQTSTGLEYEVKKRQCLVKEKQTQLNLLVSHVPLDILDIVGKTNLENTLGSLTDQLKALEQQKDKFTLYQEHFATLTLRK